MVGKGRSGGGECATFMSKTQTFCNLLFCVIAKNVPACDAFFLFFIEKCVLGEALCCGRNDQDGLSAARAGPLYHDLVVRSIVIVVALLVSSTIENDRLSCDAT